MLFQRRMVKHELDSVHCMFLRQTSPIGYQKSSRTSSPEVAKRRSSIAFAWFLCAGYMVLIFYFSSLSQVPIPVLFHAQDFFLHMLEYSILSYLLSIAFASTGLRRIPLYAFLFTVFYGASDELHQIFVPLRDPSLLDVAADALGGLLGMFVFHSIVNPDHHAGPVRREEKPKTRNTRLEAND